MRKDKLSKYLFHNICTFLNFYFILHIRNNLKKNIFKSEFIKVYLATQKGPDTRSKCVMSMSPAQADQSGAVRIKFGPPGPSEDHRGPQKGHFGPKRALLGPPGAFGTFRPYGRAPAGLLEKGFISGQGRWEEEAREKAICMQAVQGMP